MGLILCLGAIAAVFIVTILITLNVIKEKWYSICLWIIAAGMVYSTTLLGIYVVGSDIQGEVYASRQTLEHGIDFFNTNSPSVISVVFAPWLSTLFKIDIIWVYKAILPLFLSLVPVVLYFAFKAQFGAKRAYFASLFFIVMPSYSMEIATIGKSMVAELFYALMIFAMVSNMKWYYKGIAITFCAIGAIASHYTIGVIVLLNLVVIFGVRLVTNWSKWKLFLIKKVSLWLLPLVLIVTLGSFYLVFQGMSGGWINHLVSNITQAYVGKVSNAGQIVVKRITENVVISTKDIQSAPAIETQEPNSWLAQSYFARMGLGLDFAEQPVEGKLFRLIQYLTQILIVIGAIALLFKHYNFTAEFIAGIGCSCGLLFLCMFLPGFSSLINATRFYHIALFFLAPLLIVGIDTLTWRMK